jgi:tetratricopeptide (TPR) repeat protein
MRALVLLVALGCSRPPPPPRAPSTTTDPGIALGNLEGELRNGEALLGKHPGSAPLMAALSSLYLTHGQLLGRLADYDRAEELAARAVAVSPRDARAWAARADVHARFHEFAAALEDLSRAQALGAGDVDQKRASIWQATGRYAEARRVREKWARALPRLETLGALATLDADEGRAGEAEHHFDEALRHVRDVNPLPLAWLQMQEAALLASEGQPSRARELLEEAHRRVPYDASVASHLAALSDRDTAVKLLRQIVAVSDDPEHLAALADRTGDATLRQNAAARYEQLLARHPAAFADHAARFYLASDPRRALALAERNLATRRTAESLDLVARARRATALSAR